MRRQSFILNQYTNKGIYIIFYTWLIDTDDVYYYHEFAVKTEQQSKEEIINFVRPYYFNFKNLKRPFEFILGNSIKEATDSDSKDRIKLKINKNWVYVVNAEIKEIYDESSITDDEIKLLLEL